MRFSDAQHMFSYSGNSQIVTVDDGTIRSSSGIEQRLNRKDWTIFVAANRGGAKLRFDTHKLALAGTAKVAFVGFDVWGGIDAVDTDHLLFIDTDWQFPVDEFDALPLSVRNEYSNRCKIALFQGSVGSGIVASNIHDAGSGVMVSQSTNFLFAGNRVARLGPSRDPLWHSDSIGLVGGGTTNLNVSDSEFDGYVRFVFEDAGTDSQGRPLPGQDHKGFLLSNLWMNTSIDSPLQFDIRGIPAGHISGHLEHLKIWGLNGGANGVYRSETIQTGGHPQRVYLRHGQKINLQPSWINVPETDVEVLAHAPSGPAPQSTWLKLDPLNVAKFLTGVK